MNGTHHVVPMERETASSAFPFHKSMRCHILDFLGDDGDFRLRAVLVFGTELVNTQHHTRETDTTS